jgi:hypothetical protein
VLTKNSRLTTIKVREFSRSDSRPSLWPPTEFAQTLEQRRFRYQKQMLISLAGGRQRAVAGSARPEIGVERRAKLSQRGEPAGGLCKMSYLVQSYRATKYLLFAVR